MKNELYKILGVAKNVSLMDLKSAYKRLAQKLHPDKPGGNGEKFKTLQKAYTILSDPEKREHYDQTGDASDRPERSRESKINEYIVSHIFNILGNFGESSVDHMDVMALLRKKLNTDKIGVIASQKKLQRKIKIFKKANKHFKGDKADIMHVAILALLGELNQGIEAIKEKLDLLEGVAETIEAINYEFEPDNYINSTSSMPAMRTYTIPTG